MADKYDKVVWNDITVPYDVTVWEAQTGRLRVVLTLYPENKPNSRINWDQHWYVHCDSIGTVHKLKASTLAQAKVEALDVVMAYLHQLIDDAGALLLGE